MTNKTQLHSGWRIQAASEIAAPVEFIAAAGFDASDWHDARLPGTVLGALVCEGIFTDPFRGTNLEKIPTEMFNQPWWYRKEFFVAEVLPAKYSLLEIDGINYRAEIWLNSIEISKNNPVRGAFRRYVYDISDALTAGKNVLALKVSPPQPGDFSIGFVDWNPPPPDKNMGIFRPLCLHQHRGVTLSNPFVSADFNTAFTSADLKIAVDLQNHTAEKSRCKLSVEFDGKILIKSVDLLQAEQRHIKLTSLEFSQLHLKNPRLWWPNNMGEPALYCIKISLEVDGLVSDSHSFFLGLRQIDSWLNAAGHRIFAINGREILIKGAGWTDDIFIRDNNRSLAAQIRYVKEMNLNCIRLEGFWGKDHQLYDLCDQNGILVMVGWSCHWEHEQYLGKPVDERFGGVTEADEIELVAESFRDQVLWLRHHAGIFCWTLASDMVPHADLEAHYIEILQEIDPVRPRLNSTGGVGSDQNIVTNSIIESDLTGSSGLKMLGPYAYTPPVYWYADKKLGGAYGFNSETCPGANVPPLDSLQKMFTEENLWPIGREWDFHGGRNSFATLDRIVAAIKNRYGEAESLQDFAFKAQILNYELMRPMFEAFQVNFPRATGIIQWMLNAAWPKTSWQLYDHFLRPNGAFFGAKKGCEPQHLVYNYGDGGIYIVDESGMNSEPLTALVRTFDFNSKLRFEKRIAIENEQGAARCIFRLPAIQELTFLDLRLLSENDVERSLNFYWLSPIADVLDYDAEFDDWAFYTPTKVYADFTGLAQMPPVSLVFSQKIRVADDFTEMEITIENTGEKIAFFVELNVVKSETKMHVLPVFWQDNYLSLLPFEKRKISVSFPNYALDQNRPTIALRGWNLKK